eukprot:304677-Chlamydomonas_euryale.AAC.2
MPFTTHHNPCTCYAYAIRLHAHAITFHAHSMHMPCACAHLEVASAVIERGVPQPATQVGHERHAGVQRTDLLYKLAVRKN